MTLKLGVVIVTYNRLEKLKKALIAYDNQKQPCSDIVIVNNASTDGTCEYLDKWQKSKSVFDRHVIHLTKNTGGSGGFYTGTQFCSSLGVDWIWLSDDDAYASPIAFESFYSFCEKHDTNVYSAICGAVYTNGYPDLKHRRLLYYKYGIKPITTLCDLSLYKEEYFKIDMLSYVGGIINNNALKKIGFCEKDFFIYCDDSEHSLRLAKYGQIICVPAIKVEHDSGPITESCDSSIIVSWRSYYATRNLIVMYKRHNIISAIVMSLMCVKSAILSTIRKNKSWGYTKLIFIAVINAWLGKLGVHRIYKPGFFIYVTNVTQKDKKKES